MDTMRYDLASRLLYFMKTYDYYEYLDCLENDNPVMDMYEQLNHIESIERIIQFFENLIEEESDEETIFTEVAKGLKNDLSDYLMMLS